MLERTNKDLLGAVVLRQEKKYVFQVVTVPIFKKLNLALTHACSSLLINRYKSIKSLDICEINRT